MKRLFYSLWAGLAAMLYSASLAAASEVAPGVEYETSNYRGDAYHVLRVDLGLVSVLPYHSPVERTVDRMIPDVQRELNLDEEVVAAINSGFFYDGDSYSRTITRSGIKPALRANLFDGRSARHDKIAARMRARAELHLEGSRAWIVPAETGRDARLESTGVYVMGGGGRLLPPPPVSLTITDTDLQPDPNATGDTSRTVAALNSGNRSELFLLTVDKSPGRGVNLARLVDLLQNLRFDGRPLYLDDAMTFDSGGSTTMWIKGAGLVSFNESPRGSAHITARPVISALMVVAPTTHPSPPPPRSPRSCDPDSPPASSSCHDWYRFGECRRLTGRTDSFETALLQDQASRHGQAMAFLAGFNGTPDLHSACGP